jgi:hypothetical protein
MEVTNLRTSADDTGTMNNRFITSCDKVTSISLENRGHIVTIIINGEECLKIKYLSVNPVELLSSFFVVGDRRCPSTFPRY